MSPAEAVQRAIERVDVTSPITHEYCRLVRDEIRETLPNALIDVFHRYVELVVQVREGDTRYELVLPLPG